MDPQDPTTDTQQPEADDHPLECRHGVLVLPTLALLRRKLSQKAKQEPKFRFYTLYDRIYRCDTLKTAWCLVLANKGAPGIDQVTIDAIAASEETVGKFLDEIQEALRTKRYQPDPVRRAYILKPNGKKRPLGIPTIRDRVIQMATLLILEPIFEADFLDCSYGYRPGRSAHQALEAVRRHLRAGYWAVYDADLQGYFDSIPHDKLMACVRKRVADRSVLDLIRMWLEAPVVEQTDDGQTKVTRPRQGTPQGGVLSPLLANLYLHWFDKRFHAPNGPAQRARAHLVRYADDFVILARYQGRQLLEVVEALLEGWLGLKINREKTRVVDLREEGASLDFLGYTFRFLRDCFGRGHQYLHVEPSRDAEAREREKLRKQTSRRFSWKPISTLVADLNRQLKGWANYFGLGHPRRSFRRINSFVRCRLVARLRRRSQRPFRLPEGVTYYRYLADLGLVSL